MRTLTVFLLLSATVCAADKDVDKEVASALRRAEAALKEQQKINWFHSYAGAYQEVKTRQLPLLMDFETSDCFYCKKLDATTFRDANVITFINQWFIPVKIDGEKETELVQTLHVQSFPTLIFIDPITLKVMGRKEGYATTTEFLSQVTPLMREMATNTMATHYSAAYEKAMQLQVPLIIWQGYVDEKIIWRTRNFVHYRIRSTDDFTNGSSAFEITGVSVALYKPNKMYRAATLPRKDVTVEALLKYSPVAVRESRDFRPPTGPGVREYCSLPPTGHPTYFGIFR